MSKIELKHIDKFYGKNHVLKDLNLTIEDGDFMTLLGPSGCGKTTTLRVVSGLEKPQNGFIYMDGKEIVNAAEAYYAPPSQRNLNLVFQSYALWPHMTVFENVSFGLKIKKIPSAEIEKMVASALERMQIGQYAKRYPTELSGGQQQRVAIARAIVSEPRLLLLDEPLSNLDAKLRVDMRSELKRLHHDTGSTIIYVTHDQTEAMTLGDRIVIMKDGFIQQIGTPQEVFDQPANLFVAGFIGSPQMNFFDGELEKKDGKYQLKVGEATVVLGGKAQELLVGKGVGERKVTVGIRPEHIAFAAAPGTDTVSSKVDVSEMMGSEVYLHVNAVGRDVVLRIPTTDLPAEHRAGIPYGTEINFAFRPDLIHLFDPETEKNLMY